ncbi:rhamnogalacturonan endolyase [Sphingomonas sp. NFR15]|nr:rhamnogalacturonan endolyase [Sphingomonas sp. NFR15]
MPNNGTKANPALQADLLGDWREEVVWRTADNRELRIYVTPYPTTHRLVTLMQDPVYRAGVAWQNTAYNQPPHLGYFPGSLTASGTAK